MEITFVGCLDLISNNNDLMLPTIKVTIMTCFLSSVPVHALLLPILNYCSFLLFRLLLSLVLFDDDCYSALRLQRYAY